MGNGYSNINLDNILNKYNTNTSNNLQIDKYSIPLYDVGKQIISNSTMNNTSNLSNQTNTTNELTKGLSNNTFGQPISYNGMTLYKLGNNVTDEQITNAFGKNARTITLGNNKYLVHNQSFLDKYGTGIKLGLGAGQLGLGIASFIENRDTMKAQRNVLKEQLREAKEEYNRIKNVRAKLNASY